MKALIPTSAAALFALLPGLAFAHAGHLAEVAGHDHVVAGVAIGVAVGVAIWSVLQGRKEAETDEATDAADEAAADEEPQEA